MIWGDLKDLLGFDSKIAYVKDKVGLLTEKLDTLQEFGLHSPSSSSPCLLRAPAMLSGVTPPPFSRQDNIFCAAMNKVQRIAAAGKNMYVRVKDHKVVEWGTGKLEEGLQWAEKEGRVIYGTVEEVKEELLREVERERSKSLVCTRPVVVPL